MRWRRPEPLPLAPAEQFLRNCVPDAIVSGGYAATAHLQHAAFSAHRSGASCCRQEERANGAKAMFAPGNMPPDGSSAERDVETPSAARRARSLHHVGRSVLRGRHGPSGTLISAATARRSREIPRRDRLEDCVVRARESSISPETHPDGLKLTNRSQSLPNINCLGPSGIAAAGHDAAH